MFVVLRVQNLAERRLWTWKSVQHVLLDQDQDQLLQVPEKGRQDGPLDVQRHQQTPNVCR